MHGITILDREGGAHTLTQAPQDPILSRADVERLVLVALAGRAAEEEILGSATSGAGGSSRSDLAIATALLASARASLGLGETLAYRASPEQAHALLAVDPELRRTVEAQLARLYGRARALVRQHRPLIEAAADVLVAEKHLSGADFRRLFAAYTRARKAGRVRTGGGRHG
ncbi:hypothetical protein JO965_47595 (plasmid) [Microvirga sp. VF16]|nr:hypothetical protein JO965_47595 [Microvirga sp. VF16]